MPEIRRIGAGEPEYSITANATVPANWDIAAARCLDYVTGRTEYGDAAKYLPESATTAAEAEADMTNKTLDTTKTVNAFLVEVAAGGTLETWWSQKTNTEMAAVSGVAVARWAYGYHHEGGSWYAILGRPCSERLAWQLQAVFGGDAALQGLINTFKHDEFSDFRIPSNKAPLLMIVPSGDREHWGDGMSDVGHHAVDIEVVVALYQAVAADHAAMGALEMRVRERITDIALIEDPRFGGYLSEEPPRNPFVGSVSKEVAARRGERFRRMSFTLGARDRISNRAGGRVY